jgi:hypothetical protein
MILLYCVNTCETPQSRTITLFNILNTLNIPFTYIARSRKVTQSFLFKYLFSKIIADYYRCKLINGFATFISILPAILFNAVILNKKISILFCFECWEFFPVAKFLMPIKNITVIVDLGYPVLDMSTVNLPPWYKAKVSKLELLLDQANTNILVESDQQNHHLKCFFKKAKVYTCFVTESVGLKSDSIIPSSSKESLPDFISFKGKYILFRGTLNLESGIMDIMQSFISHFQCDPTSCWHLLIHGRGEFQDDVALLASSTERISYISHRLTVPQLKLMMTHSAAIIGQFNLSSNRPYLTVPHKFIEALKLQKLYLTPFRPPLEYYLSKLLSSKQLECLKASADPFTDWLIWLTQYNNFISSYDIQHASAASLDFMEATNKHSLQSALSYSAN